MSFVFVGVGRLFLWQMCSTLDDEHSGVFSLKSEAGRLRYGVCCVLWSWWSLITLWCCFLKISSRFLLSSWYLVLLCQSVRECFYSSVCIICTGAWRVSFEDGEGVKLAVV